MSAFDHSLESRGWPFSDCAIHVQFRGDDNRRFNLDEVRQTCEGFGRILKIYVWTAKRSQKPQACVLFDSIEGVKAADRSTHSGRRLTSNVAIKRTGYQVHPPTRGIKSADKAHRPIPTGPRYQPYSLDARPQPPHSPPRASPPETIFVSFPPKREPISPAGPLIQHHMKPLSFSPSRSNHLGGPPLAVKQATSSSPAKPSSRSRIPEQAGPSQSTQTECAEQAQINQKLKPDIRDSVSIHIESMATKMQEIEAENQRLKARLRNSEGDLALLEDTVKRVEGREQAAIALLTETETRSQEQLQSLRNSFKAAESVKAKAEAELETLKQKYGILEAQLLSTQEQLRLFSLSKRSVDRSIGVHSDPPRPGLETDKASTAEQDDTCITPSTATDFARNAGLEKGTLQNLAGLLDAFKEIDDLVRSAFHP
ncbi:unnamed protein product [Rhizoctonia solani]|uniref:RRM domain-containing protein n=1 Tax=Rhizoctonia solani TaxID=456999 RepID=A0A8H2Y3U3_9AGAM|nr:unnamed protein product [Rhizoctonia solani]